MTLFNMKYSIRIGCCIGLVAIAFFWGRSMLMWTVGRLVCNPLPARQLINVRGLDFKMQAIDCALIGSNWLEHVWVSKTGFWGNWEEVFVFDPNFIPPKYNPSPIGIDVSEGGDITISVATLSSVDFQKAGWNGREIHYRIGYVSYGNQRGNERNDLACRRVPRRPIGLPGGETEPEFSLDCTPHDPVP